MCGVGEGNAKSAETAVSAETMTICRPHLIGQWLQFNLKCTLTARVKKAYYSGEKIFLFYTKAWKAQNNSFLELLFSDWVCCEYFMMELKHLIIGLAIAFLSYIFVESRRAKAGVQEPPALRTTIPFIGNIVGIAIHGLRYFGKAW